MVVVSEDVVEEGAAGRQDQLVGLKRSLIFSDQSHIQELFFLSEQTEGPGYIGLEVIPLQVKLL